MELIAQGAEAKLFKVKKGKQTVLLKERVSKAYRCKELDSKIRSERTSIEAGLLAKAKSAGVNTPNVLETDKKKFKITMEFIDGKRAKDFLQEKNFEKTCLETGKAIAKMHFYGIIHGDLTTSNILVKEGELFFIDFGLGFRSKKIEDKAVDLLVFKKTFEATHHKLMPRGWETILKGYALENPEEAGQVFRQIEAVEKRGRYH